METFGYLPRPNDKTEGLKAESLYAATAISDGIRNIQRFGGLEETGKLNEETVKLFSAPRCGVKDILNEGERRKRYIIGARNWEKRQLTYL
jgi:Putative peptidoglycan binding domain